MTVLCPVCDEELLRDRSGNTTWVFCDNCGFTLKNGDGDDGNE